MNWRDRLREELDRRGLNMREASIRAGLNPTAVQQILTGGKDPRTATITQLARTHGISLDAMLLGRDGEAATLAQFKEPRPASADAWPQVKLAPVVGETAAGVWIAAGAPPQRDAELFPYLSTRFAGLTHTAYKVAGHSMDLARIYDGDLVLTVPYWEARMGPAQDDIVVFEHPHSGNLEEDIRPGTLIERTLRQVEVGKEVVRLISRASDPKLAKVTSIPWDVFRILVLNSIVGLVIGSYTRF